MLVENVIVEHPLEMATEEASHYAREEIALWREKGKMLDKVIIFSEDSYVMVKAVERSPIRRIRRITGYLSEVSNFNDAKRERS